MADNYVIYSFAFSHKDYVEIKFSAKPTSKELYILIEFCRFHLRILEDIEDEQKEQNKEITNG